MARALREGDRVQSKAVGCVGRFAGVIVGAFTNHKRQRYYHVKRLSDGVIWHRDPYELTRVTRRSKTP